MKYIKKTIKTIKLKGMVEKETIAISSKHILPTSKIS